MDKPQLMIEDRTFYGGKEAQEIAARFGFQDLRASLENSWSDARTVFHLSDPQDGQPGTSNVKQAFEDAVDDESVTVSIDERTDRQDRRIIDVTLHY